MAVIFGYQWLRDRRTPDEGTSEWVRHLYVTDQIDEREMERRLDVLEDPEADRIRKSVERVSGIGESRSWAIAARFRSLDEVRAASVDELTAVPDIGEYRAQALKEEL